MQKVKQLQVKTQKWVEQYARYITPGALLFGFITDNIILQQVDTLFTLSIMLYHFTLISIGILILHGTHHGNEVYGKTIRLLRDVLSIAIPFSFGSLFSGFFIFYSQSAGAITSWIFLITLILFMISTEYYKKHYLNTVVQVTLWYFTLLSLLILYLPIALREMNAAIFIIAGFSSLLIAAGFLNLLTRVEPVQYQIYARVVIRNIIMVFTIITTLYFTNIIPPIPLALKHMGVYYSVERIDNSYVVSTEQFPWYSPKRYKRTTMHHLDNTPIYAFSSVFAPERLSPELFHQWQYKDNNGTWQTASTIGFTILGGRSEGYRGYTVKENLWPGKWRVRLITKQGQVVGTTNFNIIKANKPTNLIQIRY